MDTRSRGGGDLGPSWAPGLEGLVTGEGRHIANCQGQEKKKGGPCPEESVQRLQQAMTKTNSRSILVQVALAVEANPWWKQQVESYVCCTPACLEKGGKALAHVATLASLTYDMSAVAALQPIVEDLPELKSSLRPGSTDDLVASVAQALAKTWAFFQEASKKEAIDGPGIASMMKLLTYASTLFPLDGAVHQMMSDCGLLLQQSGKAEILNDLKKKLQTVEQAQVVKIQDVTTVELQKFSDLEGGVLASAVLQRGPRGEEVTVGLP